MDCSDAQCEPILKTTSMHSGHGISRIHPPDDLATVLATIHPSSSKVKAMTPRGLNRRFAAALLVVIVTIGGGVHLLHGMQVRRTAVALLDRAMKAEKAGRLDRAEDYLQRYLTYRPADVDGLVRLGDLLEKRAGTGEARQRILDVFEKAVRLAPDRLEIRRHLVDLQVADGRLEEAKAHAEVLAAADPEDARLAILLGRCEEGVGRPGDASALYERARILLPTSIEAHVRLANLLRTRLSDPTRADKVMDARAESEGLIAANPRSADAYLARAEYRAKYAVPGVDPSTDVAKALELAPDDADVLQVAARVARSKGDARGALQLLEHASKLHPEIGAVYESLADLEREAGRVDRAADWLRRGIAKLPEIQEGEQALLRWTLADLLIQAGRVAEAEPVIAALRGTRVRPELIEYLAASSLAARGRNAEAARILTGVAPTLGALPEMRALTKRSLMLLARCHERMGNDDQRLDACRRAVAIDLEPDPMRVTARYALAAAQVAMDKIEEALDTYRRIANDSNASLAIARLQILQNLRRPDEQRRWEDVGRTLDAVEQGLAGREDSGRAGAEIAILRAESLAIQGRFDKAMALLDQTLAKQPDQIDLWVAKANLIGRGDRASEALTILDEAGRRLGDRVELRLARVGYWSRAGGDGAAAALAVLESDAGKFDEEGQASLLRELAIAQGRIGKEGESARLWKRLAGLRPEDLNVRLTLFDLAVREKNREESRAALDQIRRIEGEDGSLWRYGRALLLIDQVLADPKDRRPLAEARAELEKVGLLRPSWSRVPLALAEIAEIDDRPDAAIREYLRAIVEMGDRSPTAIRRSARLLWDRQRFAEADLVLKKLREGNAPLSGEMRRLAAQVAFQNQDYAQALGKAEEIVSDRSDNYRDLLWLGQLRWAAGQPAEPLFRRAIALAKDAPEARTALIAYLAGSGHKPEAEVALEQAEKDLPRAKAILALAQGREAIGQVGRAETLYREAIASRPDDIRALRGAATFYLRNDRPAESEPLLRKIIDMGGATTDASWARRVLATVLAGQGGHRRALQALEVLGLSEHVEAIAPSSDETTPEDLRARSRVLALQPSRARRREAIRILERLINRNLSQTDDLALLAQLLEADGDWPKSRQMHQQLLARRGSGPDAVASYIRALLRHGQPEEASISLARLEAMAPGSPTTVEIKARILHADGRDEQATEILSRFASEDDARLEGSARLCEELGQMAAAERLYRLSMDRQSTGRPSAALALAGFLGRRGRVDEAFDLLESRAWGTLPASQVSGVALMILYASPRREAPQFERLGRRLEKFPWDDPAALSLRFDLANLRCLEGRYDDAEMIFREIAARNKTLGSPLNNLAWMLALRPGDKASEALNLIGQAIALEGEVPGLLDTRAVVLLAMNRADLAARDLEDAIAVSPTAEKYFHLARAYLNSGRRADAERSLREAERRGLAVGGLHPLEQATYRQLAADLPAR